MRHCLAQLLLISAVILVMSAAVLAIIIRALDATTAAEMDGLVLEFVRSITVTP